MAEEENAGDVKLQFDKPKARKKKPLPKRALIALILIVPFWIALLLFLYSRS